MTGRGKAKRGAAPGAPGAEAQAAQRPVAGEGEAAGEGAGEVHEARAEAAAGAGEGALNETPGAAADQAAEAGPAAGAEGPDADADADAGAGAGEGALHEAPAGTTEAGAASEGPEAVARRLERENESLQERLLRLSADFENHRKRTAAERQQALRYGSENLLRDLLHALDDLERAAAYVQGAGEAPGDAAESAQGVELVARGIFAALQKHGLSPVEAQGKPFDPKLHEAMSQVESAEHPEGAVIEVLQKGYLLHERLLRPARVVVAKAPTAAQDTPPAAPGDESAPPGRR